jgi:hypothetical protein
LEHVDAIDARFIGLADPPALPWSCADVVRQPGRIGTPRHHKKVTPSANPG